MTDWSDCPQADFGYCARIQCLENPPAGGCTVAAYCIPSFFKKEIDLALLRIEKWADDRAYFCTPRKAGIIGRNGVSGALCRHELYRYAGTAGRRYDPCGLRRRGSPQTGALRPGSAENYFVCSRERVYRAVRMARAPAFVGEDRENFGGPVPCFASFRARNVGIADVFHEKQFENMTLEWTPSNEAKRSISGR